MYEKERRLNGVIDRPIEAHNKNLYTSCDIITHGDGMMRLICLLKKKKKGKCMYSAPVLGLRDTTSIITRSSGEKKKSVSYPTL